MSRIFDALQRSESERSGTDSGALPQGPDLLRRAEGRVLSKWQAAASGKGSETPTVAPTDEGLGTATILPATGGVEVVGCVENPSAHKQFDSLSRFQPMAISLPSQSRLVCLTDRENPAAEAVRLLGVRLRDLRRVRPLKSVLITSTIPQEGKSMISANLACALAHASSEKTLLVEGDLRRPSLSQMFGIHREPGLWEWLREEEQGPPANIYHLEEAGLWFMPAGSAPGNPLELLQSQKLPALMRQLSACFDWIIVDSPPVLPLADTSIWMRLADGIFLVTRQGTTEKQQLLRGLEALNSNKLLGAVLNSTAASAYGGYYYRSPPPSL